MTNKQRFSWAHFDFRCGNFTDGSGSFYSNGLYEPCEFGNEIKSRLEQNGEQNCKVVLRTFGRATGQSKGSKSEHFDYIVKSRWYNQMAPVIPMVLPIIISQIKTDP